MATIVKEKPSSGQKWQEVNHYPEVAQATINMESSYSTGSPRITTHEEDFGAILRTLTVDLEYYKSEAARLCEVFTKQPEDSEARLRAMQFLGISNILGSNIKYLAEEIPKILEKQKQEILDLIDKH